MVQSWGKDAPSHGHTVIKALCDSASHTPRSWAESPFPKADSAVQGKGDGHSAHEPTKTGKLLECGAELKTQVPPQGWKGYQVLKLDLQPPPTRTRQAISLSQSPFFSPGFSLKPCEPSTFQQVPHRPSNDPTVPCVTRSAQQRDDIGS